MPDVPARRFVVEPDDDEPAIRRRPPAAEPPRPDARRDVPVSPAAAQPGPPGSPLPSLLFGVGLGGGVLLLALLLLELACGRSLFQLAGVGSKGADKPAVAESGGEDRPRAEKAAAELAVAKSALAEAEKKLAAAEADGDLARTGEGHANEQFRQVKAELDRERAKQREQAAALESAEKRVRQAAQEGKEREAAVAQARAEVAELKRRPPDRAAAPAVEVGEPLALRPNTPLQLFPGPRAAEVRLVTPLRYHDAEADVVREAQVKYDPATGRLESALPAGGKPVAWAATVLAVKAAGAPTTRYHQLASPVTVDGRAARPPGPSTQYTLDLTTGSGSSLGAIPSDLKLAFAGECRVWVDDREFVLTPAGSGPAASATMEAVAEDGKKRRLMLKVERGTVTVDVLDAALDRDGKAFVAVTRADVVTVAAKLPADAVPVIARVRWAKK